MTFIIKRRGVLVRIKSNGVVKTHEKIINLLVDWGRSFVDPNGSFYSGTTEDQKDIAVRIIKESDQWIYLSDVHPRTSTEFLCNGGKYLAHNLLKKDWYDLEKLGLEAGKIVTPQLTDKVQTLLADKPSGLLVPRHVYFQNRNSKNPCFEYNDIKETFNLPELVAEQFLEEETKYVLQVKHLFNGAGSRPTSRRGHFLGVPDHETDIFEILEEKYGEGEGLTFNITGVVMGICVYQTAAGVVQRLPRSKVNIIADGATHLLAKQFGFEKAKVADDALKAMCLQVGVNYLTCNEYFSGGI